MNNGMGLALIIVLAGIGFQLASMAMTLREIVDKL